MGRDGEEGWGGMGRNRGGGMGRRSGGGGVSMLLLFFTPSPKRSTLHLKSFT